MSLQTKSQVRIQSSQLLLTGDEPMLRRLKPPYKIDKATGKVLPDYIDEDGIGHLKNRKWFSHVKHKGKTIDVSLDANEREVQKAVMNLGLLLQDLKLGKTPNGTRKKIRLLKPERPLKGDSLASEKTTLILFLVSSLRMN